MHGASPLVLSCTPLAQLGCLAALTGEPQGTFGHDPLATLTTRSKDAATNPRGIPSAPFVDKVEDYVSSRAEVDGTMKSFQEMISSGAQLPLQTQG